VSSSDLGKYEDYGTSTEEFHEMLESGKITE